MGKKSSVKMYVNLDAKQIIIKLKNSMLYHKHPQKYTKKMIWVWYFRRDIFQCKTGRPLTPVLMQLFKLPGKRRFQQKSLNNTISSDQNSLWQQSFAVCCLSDNLWQFTQKAEWRLLCSWESQCKNQSDELPKVCTYTKQSTVPNIVLTKDDNFLGEGG